MAYHRLLIRQLSKFKLIPDAVPDQEAWVALLQRVSNTYDEIDQEKYLIERSMDISSREMLELNRRYEYAQRIAHLGYWFYDRKEKKATWSNELYSMVGVERNAMVSNYKYFIRYIYRADRKKLNAAVKNAFTQCKTYELEIRVLNNKSKQDYQWFFVIINPNKSDTPIRYISGIAMDITVRKQAEQELTDLNQQLLESARSAGMAEVATTILHNIGNVLNSVSVSAGIIKESCQPIKIAHLADVATMLETNKATLAHYLTNDLQGKLLPSYLIAFAKTFQQNYATIIQEIQNLDTHINHIKSIVAMQQVLSGGTELNEKIDVCATINFALKMLGSQLNNKGITLKKDYPLEDIIILTNKSRLLQILVNLIRNAKDALVEQSEKKLTISVKLLPNQLIQIVVRDIGVGIPADSMVRIFSMGFTTKPTGHGFGLHSSAIAAKALGGTLSVESKGLGLGAAFTLTLPLKPRDHHE